MDGDVSGTSHLPKGRVDYALDFFQNRSMDFEAHSGWPINWLPQLRGEIPSTAPTDLQDLKQW